MSNHISVAALIIAIIALFNSYDADAKGTRGGGRAYAKGHKAHSQRSHVHRKSENKKIIGNSEKKSEVQKPESANPQNPQVVNNYYGNSGNSGNAASSIMPVVAGAALGYTAASMLNNNDNKDSEKDSKKITDELKSNVHPQERLND